MITRPVTISNKLGIHARAAGALVRLSSSFSSEILIEKDGTSVNAKSIMGLLLLAAGHGSTIRVTTEGDDEKEAMAAVEELIRGKFHEE